MCFCMRMIVAVYIDYDVDTVGIVLCVRHVVVIGVITFVVVVVCYGVSVTGNIGNAGYAEFLLFMMLLVLSMLLVLLLVVVIFVL